MLYVVWILAAVAVVAAVWSIVFALRASKTRGGRAGHSRTALVGDADRIPFRDEVAPAGVGLLPENPPPGSPVLSDSLHGEPVEPWTAPELDSLMDESDAARQGWPRRVMTPNGPMELTAPPFKLRNSIMSWRERAYARAITARMPSGYVLCPQLRLDTLLIPTRPDERPADDWRTWRQRVRVRAVDFVVCRLPDWAPVLAIEIDRGNPNATLDTQDKMTLETLAEVGLPLVRCSGSPEKDWPMIEPYVPEFDDIDEMPPGAPGAPGASLDDRPAESA